MTRHHHPSFETHNSRQHTQTFSQGRLHAAAARKQGVFAPSRDPHVSAAGNSSVTPPHPFRPSEIIAWTFSQHTDVSAQPRMLHGRDAEPHVARQTQRLRLSTAPPPTPVLKLQGSSTLSRNKTREHHQALLARLAPA